MSDNTPDFDNMTPEEIMAWMETLAKRQGASEGFTTAADMEIAEIDPNSVVIDEPGYVPYGQEKVTPAPKATPAPAPIKPPAQEPAPARSTFQAPPAPVQPAAQVRPLSPVQPARPPTPPPPRIEPAPTAPPDVEPMPVETPTGESALAWLESLAAEQSEQLFNLDLSGLSADAGGAAAAAPAEPVNPMTWLEDLARSQSTEPSLETLSLGEDVEESEKLNPFAEGVNPMEWLETLAKRQGAKQEELTTRAGMNIPTPTEAEVEDDDYQPFSFDTPPARRTLEPATLENPADWLNSIAGAEGYSEEGVRATRKAADTPADEMSLAEVEAAIANGTVTREQMQYFLDQQASQLAAAPDEESDLIGAEADSALEPADLPDWLSQLRPETPQPEPTKPIDALFETPTTMEMPDWLAEDALMTPADDLQGIFAPDEEASRPLEPVTPLEATAGDEYDSWVEAFDEEYAQGGLGDTGTVPDWYEQNVNDPARLAAVDSALEADVPLAEAALPEENGLPAGQPQSLPSWMPGAEAAAELEAETEAASGGYDEMPEWLKEVEASVAPEEVPDWLVETIGLSEPAEAVEPPTEAAPSPVYTSPPAPVRAAAPAPTPAPQPARVLSGDTAAVLVRARDMEQSGDLEGALAEYESVIRAGADLEAVVADLGLLVKSYKTTPAVYRVLGDGLMRQGKLQAALNTYREALNQL